MNSSDDESLLEPQFERISTDYEMVSAFRSQAFALEDSGV